MPRVISSIASASLWGPPTTWTRTSGLRATKAAARERVETPRPGARRATRTAIAEDRGRRGRLEDVDGGTDRQPGQRVGRQREERAVGAGRLGPGDVGEGRVGGGRRRRVDVGIEAVEDAEPGVVDVAVDVVREQRRERRRRGRRGRRSRPRASRDRAAAPAARRGRRGIRPTSGVGDPRREAQLFAPGFFARHRRRRRPPPAGAAAPASVPGRPRARRRRGCSRRSLLRRFRAARSRFFFGVGSGRRRAVAARRGGGERAEEGRPADRLLRLARIPRRGLRRRSRASARFRPGRCRRRR